MAYYPATSFVPQFFSDPGVPLAGGSISAQIAGSSTPTPMYLDGSGTSAGISITLNARGEPQVSGNTITIWLDSDVSYKFILKDASAVSKWTIDAISNPNFGLSDTTNPLLGDYLIGTHRTGTGAVAMRLHNWIETRTYNIKDFVDPTVTTTDWTAAINLAYARIPSTGGILEFPEGDFAFNTALSFTDAKPFLIKGQGEFATRLRPTFAAENALTINGPTLCGLRDIRIDPTIARTSGTYDIAVQNSETCLINNIYLNNTTGGLLKIDTCNFLKMDGVRGESGNASNRGDTCLKIKSVGGSVDNTLMRTLSPSGVYSNGPCLYLTGQSTSFHMGGSCIFSGGGPKSTWAISTITSTGANFTVTTTAAHDFQVGDFIVLRGCTPTAYNKQWRIASVISNAVVVTSAANPGTTTINGTAESIAACGLVTNEDGAFNESSISGGVLFEAQQPNLYGTASLYFDGRRGAFGTKAAIQGWNITGNYYDFGIVGVLISGTASSGSNDPTVFGFDVDGTFESTTRALHLDQVQGITIGHIRNAASVTITDDNISSSAAVYIYAGPGAPYAQGITMQGGNLGQTRSWFSGFVARCFKYGILLDSPGINDLIIEGCNIFGTLLPIGEINSPMATAQRWKIKNNTLANVTWPIDNATVIPSVASATTININPYHDVQKITGTTNIQTINPAYIGMEKTMIFTGALTLVTGGNLAIAANHNVLAGEAVNFYNDGTSWYLK